MKPQYTFLKRTGTVALAALPFLLPELAHAAGGFAQATGIITQIRDSIYAIVGICAGLALLWCFAMGWSGRKTWTDVLELGLWIVGAAAAIALATWLWNSGGSMSF